MIKIKLPTKQGRKRRFVICGALNLVATNLFLQLLLIIFNTGFSTLLSQIFNMVLGFFLYGKKVFRVNTLKQAYGFKYLILATSLWLANWLGINIISQYSIPRNIAAILLIPWLATYSYFAQMYLVFPENNK